MNPLSRHERGVSLSSFLVTVVMALLLMGGLVVDGGAQSAASRECQQVAAEAARAATDASALARASGGTPSTTAMVAAARAVLAGHPRVAGTVSISGGRVSVDTTASAPTVFLSMIRIASLPAHGHAVAVLKGSGG